MNIEHLVREVCQELLLKCKALMESVEKRSSEEEQMEALKATAAATFKLGNVVHDHITSRQEISTTQIQEGFLYTYTQKLRETVVSFLKNARRSFANPFDYLTEQDLKNSLKEVVSTTKQVVDAAKTLAEAEREEEAEGSLDEEDSTSASTAETTSPTVITSTTTMSASSVPTNNISTSVASVQQPSVGNSDPSVLSSGPAPKKPPPVPPRSTKPSRSRTALTTSDNTSSTVNSTTSDSTDKTRKLTRESDTETTDKALGVVDALTQMLETSTRIEQAVMSNDVQTLTDTARFIISHLQSLTSSLLAFGRSLENIQSMRESCIKVINAAKIAMKKPNDVVLYEQLKTANEEFVAVIRNNIFEISVQNNLLTRSSSRPKVSDRLLRHASIMLVASPVSTPRSSDASLPSPSTTTTKTRLSHPTSSTSTSTTTTTTTTTTTSSSAHPSEMSPRTATSTSTTSTPPTELTIESTTEPTTTEPATETETESTTESTTEPTTTEPTMISASSPPSTLLSKETSSSLSSTPVPVSSSSTTGSSSQLPQDPQRSKLMKQIRARAKKTSNEQTEEGVSSDVKNPLESAEKKKPRKKIGDSQREGKKANEPLTAGNGPTSPSPRPPPEHSTLIPVTISKTQPDIKTEFAERILKLFTVHFPQLKKELSSEAEHSNLTHKIVQELAEYHIRILTEKEMRMPTLLSLSGPNATTTTTTTTTTAMGHTSPRTPTTSTTATTTNFVNTTPNLKLRSSRSASTGESGPQPFPFPSPVSTAASPLKKKEKETHNTIREKKQKKHRSVKESHDKDKEEAKKEKDRRRITGLGTDGNEAGASVSWDTDTNDSSTDDKVTNELKSFMNANSDWSQGMTMKLKGSRRGTLTWKKKIPRKAEKTPTTPNELIERTQEFTRSVCELLSVLYDLTQKPVDDEVDAKLTKLGLCVQKVFDNVKTILDCLHEVVGTLKEDSGLAATLTRVQEEVEKVETRGKIAEIDSELLSQGHFAQLIQTSFTQLIYNQCLALENLTAQISVDVVALQEKNKDKNQPLNEEAEAVVIHILALFHCFRDRVQSALNDWEMIRYIALNVNERTASGKEVGDETSTGSTSLLTLTRKGGAVVSSNSSTTSGSSARSSSLWDDLEPDPTDVNNPLLNPNNPYRAGTLNNLIRRLTPEDKSAESLSAQLATNAPPVLPEEETPRVGFFKTFLLTYRSFTNAATLFDKLVERYHVPPKAKYSPEEIRTIKQRVCEVLKWWINESSYDFDNALLSKIRHFIETSLKKDKLDSLASNLLENLNKIEKQRSALASFAPPKPPPREISPVGMKTSLSLLDDYDELVIAQQLTQIEFDIYKRIGSWELQGQAWNKKPLQPLARNVITLIQRANRVSFWLATIILLQPRIKDRSRILKKIITIAKHLKDLNNYYTLMEFVAALNTSPVSRLKHTFNALPKNLLETMKSLQQVVDPTSSFKQLREAIKTSGRDILPYIGTYLTDITFIDDGNPDHVMVGNKKLINFAKWRLLYVAIQQVRFYQQSKFNFGRHEPLTSFLIELPALGEHELYKLSLEREPRNAERADIR